MKRFALFTVIKNINETFLLSREYSSFLWYMKIYNSLWNERNPFRYDISRETRWNSEYHGNPSYSLDSQFLRHLREILRVTFGFTFIFRRELARIFHLRVIRDTFSRGERHYESRRFPYWISEFDDADAAW